MHVSCILLAKRLLFARYLVAALPLLLSQPAAAVPAYNIVPLGFGDLEHTRSDGYMNSAAQELNAAGHVLGSSHRYNGGDVDKGRSTWLFNGSTTVAIGLTGAEHTSSTGYKSSFANQMNEAGQARGYSYRFSPFNSHGQSAWWFNGSNTIDIGLVGIEHTRNDGYKRSDAEQLNEKGQVRGYSDRFNGGLDDLGRSAWLFNGSNTLNIGLTGVEHTRGDGYQQSVAHELNERGDVRGYSLRYNGDSTGLGHTAWMFKDAITIDIGLTDAEHTRDDGYRASLTWELNEAGQVLGFSERFSGGTLLGESSWLYNGTVTLNIGLIDIEHTASNGMRGSSAVLLTESGRVAGFASRYLGGSVWLGRSSWLFDGTATLNVGLTDSEHTRNDGFRDNSVERLTENGQILGYADRFSGGTSVGQSTWLFNGNTTLKIGLIGTEHTRNDGYKSSSAEFSNEFGQVIGHSDRFNSGAIDLGQSAWLYNGNTTLAVGLVGTEHTRNDGYKYSVNDELNESGQAQGYSERFSGGNTDLGRSAWMFNGTTTVNIGLAGAEHTRNDGYKLSTSDELNEAGQVIGWSSRYLGGSSYMGQTAWVYDSTLDQTVAFVPSTRGDGYAYSTAAYLGEDGLVLGSYTLFDALDTNLGPRAFYFTIADGLHDLGSLVDGGLGPNGWDSLATAIRANGLGQILGHGKLTSQSGGRMAYLLTSVPEPTAALLATLAIAGPLLLRQQRPRPRS